MEVATTTAEANLSAINESLVQIGMTLGRIAARQDHMLVNLKKMTVALAPTATTTPARVSGQVLEQQTTMPSSPSLFSANHVMVTGAPQADGVLALATPTRCSTLGLAGNFGDNHGAHHKLQGLVGLGMNMHAGCSTHFLTSALVDPGVSARYVDTDMQHGLPCQVKEHPANRRLLLPHTSFPCFNGNNPRLWRYKCLEYFKLFNINECMWVTAATLHMEGAAAHWYKEYRLSQPVGDWSQFIGAVEAKFCAEDFSQMLGSHVVELSSSSSSSRAVIPGLQDADVHVLQPETLVVEATHFVCEEVLVVSEDKTNMDCAVCQTYDEICDDVITHVGSMSLFHELDLSFGEDLCTEKISKDMASDEELVGTMLMHVGDWSLFTEHDMDTFPEFQLLVGRLHSSWDPGGSTVAQLALNSTPFDGHNIVYSQKNHLMDSMSWEDNKAVILEVELYVQWDPGIMTSMHELSHMMSLVESATTANALEQIKMVNSIPFLQFDKKEMLLDALVPDGANLLPHGRSASAIRVQPANYGVDYNIFQLIVTHEDVKVAQNIQLITAICRFRFFPWLRMLADCSSTGGQNGSRHELLGPNLHLTKDKKMHMIGVVSQPKELNCDIWVMTATSVRVNASRDMFEITGEDSVLILDHEQNTIRLVVLPERSWRIHMIAARGYTLIIGLDNLSVPWDPGIVSIYGINCTGLVKTKQP